MKTFLKILIILSLFGAIRVGVVGLFPERWAERVLIPVTEYNAATHTGVCMIETPQGDARITVVSTSPMDAPTDNDQLLLEVAGEEQVSPSRVGEVLSIDGADYRIDAVRPWSGVMPDPQGLPMMSISVASEEGSWVENQPLTLGGNLLVGDTQITLHQLNPNQTLAERLSELLADPARGRWGIYDGDQTIWFDGFAPGSGAEHSDGTVFTLIAFTPTLKTNLGLVPAVRVRVKQGDVETDRIVTTRNKDTQIVLEYPDTVYHQVDIGVFGMNAPQVVLRTLEGRREEGTLAQGVVWRPRTFPLMLRHEQYVSSGVFVQTADSPFMEAVLVGEARRLRVRQGEVLRVGDDSIRYRRVLPEGAIRYTFHLDDPAWTSPELKSGEEAELILFGHRGLVKYENIDMSRGVDVEILPQFMLNRFLCFIGFAVLLILCIRLSAPKSLSDDPKSL
jgi:hypothetical protein